jgi:ABC-type polysaccharide/polyol phosphate export permease
MERIWKLAQIDFKRRYYNDRLGLLWALINPLFQIGIYYFVFTRVFGSREENFVLFLFCGILIWGVFSEISRGGMIVLKTKRYLIENIQFDKVDLFISHAISVFMAFFFNLSVYVVLAAILGISFSGLTLFLIPVLVTLFIISVAMALILATAHIFIDDILHLWDILIFIGFWTSGIIYPGADLTKNLPFLNYINPFLGLIENGRAAILYDQLPDFFFLAYNLAFAMALFGIGIFFFRRCEHLILEKQ